MQFWQRFVNTLLCNIIHTFRIEHKQTVENYYGNVIFKTHLSLPQRSLRKKSKTINWFARNFLSKTKSLINIHTLFVVATNYCCLQTRYKLTLSQVKSIHFIENFSLHVEKHNESLDCLSLCINFDRVEPFSRTLFFYHAVSHYYHRNQTITYIQKQ